MPPLIRSSLGNALHGRLRAALLLGLLAFHPFSQPLLMAAGGAMERARTYFDAARAAHSQLQNTPMSKRTSEEYTKLIESFRRVYLTAPTYGNSTISLMAIGELSEEMARRWNEPKYFQQAIDAYGFILREYPQSQFRFDARLAIARIYRHDLQQPDKALAQFERYLADYPNSVQSKLARQAATQLRDELGTSDSNAQTAASQSRQGTLSGKPVTELAPIVKGPVGSAKPSAVSAISEPASTLAAITDIRYWTNPETSRVVIDVGELTSGKLKYQAAQLSSPPRLYIDLQDTRVPRPAGGRTLDVNGHLLKRVRLAQFDKRVSRLVLDLGADTDYQISELTHPYRLVIDVRGRVSELDAAIPVAAFTSATAPAPGNPAVEPAAASPADFAPSSIQEGREQPVPVQRTEIPPTEASPDEVKLASAKPAPSPAPEIAQSPKTSATSVIKDAVLEKGAEADANLRAAAPIRGGTHSLTRALGLKIGRIFIDAGHGGHDTGTIGPGGLTEKDLALDLAQRLGKLIREKLGSEVVYSRDDDTFVTLESRVALANEAEADLFLSVHLNSSAAKTATGIETYYLNFTSDPEALKVAARENSGAQETIANLQGIVRKIALQEKLDESKEFAARMQAALRKTLTKGMSRRVSNQFDRGVKTAPFVVLIGANMPSILAEVSFLSNPAEEKRLRTPEHRQKLAEALFVGVSSYVDSLSGVKIAPRLPAQEAPSLPPKKGQGAPAKALSAPPAPSRDAAPASLIEAQATQPENVAQLR